MKFLEYICKTSEPARQTLSAIDSSSKRHMGAQLSLIAQTAPSIAISSYIDVLSEVHYVSQLNSSRFLKTCKALDPNGEVVIKVFIKPADNYNLKTVCDALNKEALILAQLPNALNYSKILETDRAGYLIRQHLKRNLYDRLSSRPFLKDVEMKFIAFQLLQVLKDIHAKEITHGDLKTENLLVTSWNWLVLTDFSSLLKPVYLPEDNPGEFSFYFDTSQRRSCYLAPERFNSEMYTQVKNKTSRVTKEMDIFSAGCCIAEIFTEGRSIFNLSQLYKYKSGDYNPQDILNQESDDVVLKELVMNMISLDPKRRLSADEILNKYRGKFFPEYFYTFTYEYFKNLAILNGNVNSLGKICGNTTLNDRAPEVDKCIDKIYKDFSKICVSLDYPIAKKSSDDSNTEKMVSNGLKLHVLGNIELQEYSTTTPAVKDESALLFLSVVLHGLRNAVSSSNKLKCLELITALSQYISDSNKLDRAVPYMVAMFSDDNPNVQGLAVQTLAQVLSMVTVLNPINYNIFVDYLLPRLKKLLQISKHNTYVRMMFADCLGDIAKSAGRFEEIASILRAPNEEASFNPELAEKYRRKLTRQFEDLAVSLLTDNQPFVKMALLGNILPLCHFFGREKTNDIILSHLITYLNDRNPVLRISLIQAISGVAILLGPITLEQYILPLLIQTTTDSEELVVVNVLQSLKILCKVGMIRKKFFYDIVSVTSTLLLHPNVWIRQFSLVLIIQISEKLSKAEVYCILYPIIRPFFEFDIQFTWNSMLTSCKKPISRTVYNLLCAWSLRASKTLFWKQVPNKDVNSFGNNSVTFITKDYTLKNYGFNSGLKVSKTSVFSLDNKEIPLTTEDKNWVDKIKTVGLHENELWKIAAIRAYVFRVAKMISRRPESTMGNYELSAASESAITLSSSSVLPRNVFFDIEFTQDSRSENSHMVLKHRHIEAFSSAGNSSHFKLPKPVDMNGSLILNTKAAPTITPNLENVYVQLEPNADHKQSANHVNDDTLPSSKFIVKNSYDGDERSVQTYLRNVQITPLLKEYKEFGAPVGCLENPKIKSIGCQFDGSLISHITEQKPTSIITLAACKHRPYVVTGSDQGLVKLWDISKLSDGKMYTSSLSYDAGSPVTAIVPIDGYDVFALSTKGGSIQLIRVHVQENSSLKTYTKFQIIRKFLLKGASEHVITMKTFINESKPLLIAVTNFCKAIILDIRTLSNTMTIENNISHGSVLSCVVSNDGTWMVLGTSKGILDLWDIRFAVLIRSWSFGNHLPITGLALYPPMSKKHERNIVVVGGVSNSILTIWDVSKPHCREIVMDSESEPSMNEFVAIEKDLDRLGLVGEKFINRTSCLEVDGYKILVADSQENEIIYFDFKNKASSKVILGPKVDKYRFKTIQVTANTSVTLKQKNLEQALDSYYSCLHHDTINAIATVRTLQKPLIVSADNSGVINIYR